MLLCIGSADASPLAKSLTANSNGEAVKHLRAFLAATVPQVLIENHSGWGNQKKAFHALKWERRGIFLRPRVHKAMRNHGVWRKTRITTRNWPGSLQCGIHGWKRTGKDKVQFTTYVTFQVGIEHWKQNWRSGVRLLSTSVRARARVHLTLVNELSIRLEDGKSFVPDAIIRFRVLQSNLTYNDVIVEHIGGIGGDGARLFGEFVHGLVQKFAPSVERKLKDKANAAIVRAADTREVRVSLSSLFD